MAGGGLKQGSACLGARYIGCARCRECKEEPAGDYLRWGGLVVWYHARLLALSQIHSRLRGCVVPSATAVAQARRARESDPRPERRCLQGTSRTQIRQMEQVSESTKLKSRTDSARLRVAVAVYRRCACSFAVDGVAMVEYLPWDTKQSIRWRYRGNGDLSFWTKRVYARQLGKLPAEDIYSKCPRGRLVVQPPKILGKTHRRAQPTC